MADDKCVAIKSSDGLRCTKKHAPNKTRCNMHFTMVERDGPNYTELCENGHVFKRRRKIMQTDFANRLHALGPRPWVDNREAYAELQRVQQAQYRQLTLEERASYDAIRTRQQVDIARTGINPDEVQDAARALERQAREANRQQRVQQWQDQQAQRANAHVAVAVAAQQAAVQRPVGNGLGAFANDRQNVHTTSAVKQTLETIKKIRTIEVPVDYRWNMKVVSKTMSEIITECYLSPAAAWQMVSKYCSDEKIYDLEVGIYGKVLDCVWQYIKNSSDKEDLKKILRSEMRDNIGMCAQGNLSRLTNILAGYVDYVVVEESMQDKLGRLLPPLMEIEDIRQRLVAAARIFTEVQLPERDWSAWASGLLIDQEDDDYREMFIHDGTIDFVVFT